LPSEGLTRQLTTTARTIRKPGRQERDHGNHNDGNGKDYKETRKAGDGTATARIMRKPGRRETKRQEL